MLSNPKLFNFSLDYLAILFRVACLAIHSDPGWGWPTPARITKICDSFRKISVRYFSKMNRITFLSHLLVVYISTQQSTQIQRGFSPPPQRLPCENIQKTSFFRCCRWKTSKLINYYWCSIQINIFCTASSIVLHCSWRLARVAA